MIFNKFFIVFITSSFFMILPGAFGSPISKEPLVILSQGKEHAFEVGIARTEEERQRGLMGQTDLKDNEGMLFLYEGPQRACFWMKNTLIPLDIILIGKEGAIIEIFSNLAPQSERKKCSSDQVLAALEIKGGLCQQLGISVGDKVTVAALQIKK